MSPLFSSGRDKWRRWEFVHPPQRAGGLGTGRERQRGGLQSEPRTSPDATGPQPPIDGSALAPGAQMRPNSQKGPAGETLRSPGVSRVPISQADGGRNGCPAHAEHGTIYHGSLEASLSPGPHAMRESRQDRGVADAQSLKALSSCRQSPPPSRPCILGAREKSPPQALQRSLLVPVLLSYKLHLTMSALRPSTQVEAGRRETQVMVVHSARFERLCCSSPGNMAMTPLAEGLCSRAREGNSRLCTIP